MSVPATYKLMSVSFLFLVYRNLLSVVIFQFDFVASKNPEQF